MAARTRTDEAPGKSLDPVAGGEQHYDRDEVQTIGASAGGQSDCTIRDPHEDARNAHDHDRWEHDPHEVDGQVDMAGCR
jgi:hypothetical protein